MPLRPSAAYFSEQERGICLEVSGIFPVGVAMRTRAVECFGAFRSSPLSYDDKKG